MSSLRTQRNVPGMGSNLKTVERTNHEPRGNCFGKKQQVKSFQLIRIEEKSRFYNNGEKVLTIVVFVHLQGFHPVTKRNDTQRLVIF